MKKKEKMKWRLENAIKGPMNDEPKLWSAGGNVERNNSQNVRYLLDEDSEETCQDH